MRESPRRWGVVMATRSWRSSVIPDRCKHRPRAHRTGRLAARYLAAAALCWAWAGGAPVAAPPVAAQSVSAVHLPAIWRGPDQVNGEIQAVHTLATTPDLVLAEVSQVWYSPPDLPNVSYLSRDGGGHWQPLATRPWLDDPGWNIYYPVRHALLSSGAGPLVVTGHSYALNTGFYETVFYVSSDYGETWSRRPLSPVDGCATPVLMNFETPAALPTRLYAVLICQDPQTGARGPFLWIESDDAGATWRTVIAPDDAGQAQYVSPARADRLYRLRDIATLDRSDDDGASWQAVGEMPSAILYLTQSAPDRLLAETFTGAFVSTDSGASWRALSPLPCPLNGNPFLAEIHAPSPLDVVRCADGNLQATGDFGQSWTALPSSPWPSDQTILAHQDQAVPGRLWIYSRGFFPTGLWRLDTAPVLHWTPTLLAIPPWS